MLIVGLFKLSQFHDQYFKGFKYFAIYISSFDYKCLKLNAFNHTLKKKKKLCEIQNHHFTIINF